ncbi:MAG TPA: T9SS type A sorting domain-containing protein [Bacteroidales bacterium]|nr:T9SS type A sorting domain-containing protein [Bacteroidales bacterium]
MKKALLLAAVFVLTIGSGIGQTVFYSDFETWVDANTPTNWIGSATSITYTDVDQYTTNPYAGTYSMQINNDTTTHKRVTTQPVSLTAGTVYDISFYARGSGEIRTGLYDGGSSYTYNSYVILDGTTWTKIEQSIICDTTTATAEFILSVRNTSATNDHLQVDSFYVTVGTLSNVSIYDIQYTTTDASSYLGQPVNTGGIVSAVKSGAYWIQSGSGPWSGVYVYDSGNSPTVGDSVTFSAVVDEYFNLTELKSVSSYVKVSSGNPVQVTNINIPDGAEEMYEGVLCKVTNAECTIMPDSYNEWVVGDGMDALKVGDLIYTSVPVLGTHYDITGVMDYNYSERKIQPRSAADVTIYNAIDETEISSSVYPNPASDFVTVSAEAEGILKVVDMTGRVVYSSIFSQQASIDVSEMEAGIYHVMITGNDGSSATIKLIVK